MRVLVVVHVLCNLANQIVYNLVLIKVHLILLAIGEYKLFFS